MVPKGDNGDHKFFKRNMERSFETILEPENQPKRNVLGSYSLNVQQTCVLDVHKRNLLPDKFWLEFILIIEALSM